jgi:uncharacterized membrane protein
VRGGEMSKFERFANTMIVYVAIILINYITYTFYNEWYEKYYYIFLVGTGVLSLITFVVYIVIDERSRNNQ